MKLFMVHVGFYDLSIGEGIYETNLNYFIASEKKSKASIRIYSCFSLIKFQISRKVSNSSRDNLKTSFIFQSVP